MEEYFNFWKICDEAKECWEDIQIDRKWQGKHPICSWQRMKNVLIDLWFPNDYYDILDYTSVDYKSVHSYEKKYVQNIKVNHKTKIITAKSICQEKKRV